MKLFEFGAFQNKMHMASREKYIFHILFGAFHGTPRIKNIKTAVGEEKKNHETVQSSTSDQSGKNY